MSYRLMNIRSANLIGTYETLEEAGQAIRDGEALHGTDSSKNIRIQEHVDGQPDKPVRRQPKALD